MSRLHATLLAAATAVALVGCGGKEPDPGPPPDLRLDQANRAGTRALAMNLPAEAIRQYREALARAYERDDADAIGDIGYNLAVALLRSGNGKEALRVARETRAELERRRLSPPADLVLVQAAAAYRAGDANAAFAATGEVLARPTREPDTAARAWYIRGMILAERGDMKGVREAANALPPSAQAGLEADRQELLGRAALLENRQADALAALEQAIQQRQQAQDYRGMARALVLAGEAARRLNRPGDAAVFFLRAGRSLVLQGDTAGGLAQLKRAEGLARQSARTDVVTEIARVRRTAAEHTDAPAATGRSSPL
jgi:hypothetical protein